MTNGLGWDGRGLSQMKTIDRRVGLPPTLTGTRPKGDGMELSPILSAGAKVVGQMKNGLGS